MNNSIIDFPSKYFQHIDCPPYISMWKYIKIYADECRMNGQGHFNCNTMM